MRWRSFSVVLGIAYSVSSLAGQSFVIKDIVVHGLQRTDAGTVFNYLPIKINETMTDERATLAIKALYATGFFKKVTLEKDGNILIVHIEERPAIASIEFEGLKTIKKEDILKSFKDIGLAESRILDRFILERAEQELKRQYLVFGNYAANLSVKIKELERNRVGLTFTIYEGDRAKIKSIHLLGVKAFSEDELIGLLGSSVTSWGSWYTKSDQYSKQKLSGDLEILRSYYLDHGYLEFSIDSTQVSISPDKQGIYITISVTEGSPYTISSIKLAGNFLIPDAELRKLITFRTNEPYSRQRMTEATKAIGDLLANEGYPFANVNAVPVIDHEKHQAAFTIFIDPGRKIYIRRINIVGNSHTRDEVIRREIRAMEGAWYEGGKLNRSRERINNLGFFEDTDIQTPGVPNNPDQVDINISLKEKPTGSLLAGIGYSSSDKFSVYGTFQQDNLFGTGNNFALTANTSSNYRTYAMSYTNPYYTLDGVSRGFDFYRRTITTGGLTLGNYDSQSYGVGVRYGVPISEKENIRYGLSVDETKLTVFPGTTPQAWVNYINYYGGTTRTILASAGWTHNGVDSRLYPTKGSIVSVGVEASTPGGDLRYGKSTATYTQYLPVTTSRTLMMLVSLGYAHGYNGYPLPFFKNFYAGGIGSVRGYDSYSLGPVDAATGSRLGGNRQLLVNAEYLFPMPGLGKDKSVRLGWFVDGGQVWADGTRVRLAELRYSAGLSLNWGSPIGPLKFSFGYPLNEKTGDSIQHWQFTIGTAF